MQWRIRFAWLLLGTVLRWFMLLASVFSVFLKTFKASLYSSEKHIIFNNVLLMNRWLALKIFKLDKHLWQCGLLKIKCSRAVPSNNFIFNNPLAIGLYLLRRTQWNRLWEILITVMNVIHGVKSAIWNIPLVVFCLWFIFYKMNMVLNYRNICMTVIMLFVCNVWDNFNVNAFLCP